MKKERKNRGRGRKETKSVKSGSVLPKGKKLRKATKVNMKIKDSFSFSLSSSPILFSPSSFSMERSCVQKILFGKEKKDMCHRFVMSVFLGKREKRWRWKNQTAAGTLPFIPLSLSLSLLLSLLLLSLSLYPFFPNRKTSSTNATYRKEIATIHFATASKGGYHRYWHECVNIQYKNIFAFLSFVLCLLSLSLSYKKLSRKKVYLSRWRNKKRSNNRTKTWRDKKEKKKKHL